MKYRNLGRTDILVSEVGFGVWTVSTGWWGEVDEARSVTLLRNASEEAINYFDTARRGQQERPQDWSEDFNRYALEQSLKRLGTEYVDFLQLHNTKMDAVEDDALFELMDEFKEEGKIRAYGVALGPKIGWLEEGVRAMRERNIDGLQMIYNLLEQDPGRGLIEAAKATGTSLIVRVPHSSGMLEGKYDENTTFAKNDHRRHRPKEWLLDGLKKVDQLAFLTESGERTLGQAALKFVLASPEIVSTLPNIYDEEQLEEFAAAPDTPDLTPEELSRVEELYESNFGLEPAR